jgi:hypothetical protein
MLNFDVCSNDFVLSQDLSTKACPFQTDVCGDSESFTLVPETDMWEENQNGLASVQTIGTATR